MKAIVCKAWGGPEQLVLEDIPLPEPGPGQVRIRVAAAGVNFPDVLIIQKKYQMQPALPFTPGAEVAGTVTAVGDGVTALRARRGGGGPVPHRRLRRGMRGRCRAMHAGAAGRADAAGREPDAGLRHQLARRARPRRAAGRRDPAGAGRRGRRRAWPRSRSARPWVRA